MSRKIIPWISAIIVGLLLAVVTGLITVAPGTHNILGTTWNSSTHGFPLGYYGKDYVFFDGTDIRPQSNAYFHWAQFLIDALFWCVLALVIVAIWRMVVSVTRRN